ncbi:hypothetical protein BDF14DRAFT_1849649 [Spinellus fusiger]|nr:hypothetical protein BDF14DRAFT_1849649 [Spinellus fusiger]
MPNQNVYCTSCSQPGHSRRTHRSCPLNSVNQQNEQMEVDSEEIDSGIQEAETSNMVIRCTSCRKYGHLRKSHRNCPNILQLKKQNQYKAPGLLLQEAHQV